LPRLTRPSLSYSLKYFTRTSDRISPIRPSGLSLPSSSFISSAEWLGSPISEEKTRTPCADKRTVSWPPRSSVIAGERELINRRVDSFGFARLRGAIALPASRFIDSRAIDGRSRTDDAVSPRNRNSQSFGDRSSRPKSRQMSRRRRSLHKDGDSKFPEATRSTSVTIFTQDHPRSRL